MVKDLLHKRFWVGMKLIHSKPICCKILALARPSLCRPGVGFAIGAAHANFGVAQRAGDPGGVCRPARAFSIGAAIAAKITNNMVVPPFLNLESLVFAQQLQPIFDVVSHFKLGRKPEFGPRLW